MSAGLSFSCSNCGKACTRFLSLCSCEEQTVEIDSDTIETIIASSTVLETLCEICGEAPALAAMAALGCKLAVFERDSPNPNCAKCGSEKVSLSERHIAYELTLDEISGESIETLVCLYVAHLCKACAPPSAGGDTVGVMQ